MSTQNHGQTATVHYTGKTADGKIFDSSREREPMAFELGAQQVIPGFEAAVATMKVGEQKTIHIPSHEAYGPHHEELVIIAQKEDFPEHIKPETGLYLQLTQEDGQLVDLMVTELTEKTVTLDGNHPLAGKDLTFELELVSVA